MSEIFFLQFYSVFVIAYRVVTFNDCVAASEELKEVNTSIIMMLLFIHIQYNFDLSFSYFI